MTSPAEDTSDLRTRVNALEHADAAINSRLNVLEQWQRMSEIDDARKDGKWINVDKRFDDLDKKIGNISNILSKIMWIFITSIIVAGVAFIVAGGLKVP